MQLPADTLIPLIERSTPPDQQLVISTMRHGACGALDCAGKRRWPRMVVLWTAVHVWLCEKIDRAVLDETPARGEESVRRWLGMEWRFFEGPKEGWGGQMNGRYGHVV